jgi:hypothetical protein
MLAEPLELGRPRIALKVWQETVESDSRQRFVMLTCARPLVIAETRESLWQNRASAFGRVKCVA